MSFPRKRKSKRSFLRWIPACAGMTNCVGSLEFCYLYPKIGDFTQAILGKI
jgi:hypothetical protein